MAQEKLDRIFLVLIMIQDGGSVAECAAIRHKDRLWLVPKWLDNPSEGTTQPERIIYMDDQPYQRGGKWKDKIFDYTLNRPISTAVLYGPNPSQEAGGFVIEMSPDIKFQRRVGLH